MIDPTFSLNFMSGSIGSGVNFSRADATATRVNGNGLVEVVSANVPRFDYDPVSRAIKGLLIEGAQTNLARFSSEFNNTAFIKNAINTTGTPPYVNVEIAPDGTQTADKVIEDVTNAQHRYITPGVTCVSGTSYTGSVYVKPGERTIVALAFTGPGYSNAVIGCFLDMQTKQFLNFGSAPDFRVVEDAPNGYLRVAITKAATASATGYLQIYLIKTMGSIGYLGEAGAGFFVWGHQFEPGINLTSYIPTASTAVTRNADVATISGTNFSRFWRSDRGSAIVKTRPSTVSGTRPWVQFDDTTADNIIALRGNTTNPELYIRASGSDQAQIDAGTIAANTRYRLAGAWATNDCAASLNSGSPVRDGVATIPVVTQARLGSDGTNYLNGHLEAIEYYDERALNASLQVLSSAAGYRSIIGPVFRDSIIS